MIPLVLGTSNRYIYRDREQNGGYQGLREEGELLFSEYEFLLRMMKGSGVEIVVKV